MKSRLTKAGIAALLAWHMWPYPTWSAHCDGKQRELGEIQKKRATERATNAINEHIETFQMKLVYHGPRLDKHPSLWLGVEQPPAILPENYLVVRITEAQAKRIVRHLAETGFLWRGTINRAKQIAAPRVPYDTWHVQGKRNDEYFEHVPIGRELIERLAGLRRVLDRDAAKAVNKVLAAVKDENT